VAGEIGEDSHRGTEDTEKRVGGGIMEFLHRFGVGEQRFDVPHGELEKFRESVKGQAVEELQVFRGGDGEFEVPEREVDAFRGELGESPASRVYRYREGGAEFAVPEGEFAEFVQDKRLGMGKKGGVQWDGEESFGMQVLDSVARFNQGLAQGTFGMVEGLKQAWRGLRDVEMRKLGMTEEQIAADRGVVGKVAGGLGEALGATGAEIGGEVAQKSVWDSPEVLADPDWWANGLGQAAGSMAMMLAPGAAVGMGMKATGAVGSVLAGASAAGQSYERQKEQGGDTLTSAGKAAVVGVAIAALEKIGLDKIFGAGRGQIVGDAVRRFFAEGGEEFAENPVTALIENLGLVGPTEYGARVLEAAKQGLNDAIFGGVVGVGAGGAGGRDGKGESVQSSVFSVQRGEGTTKGAKGAKGELSEGRRVLIPEIVREREAGRKGIGDSRLGIGERGLPAAAIEGEVVTRGLTEALPRDENGEIVTAKSEFVKPAAVEKPAEPAPKWTGLDLQPGQRVLMTAGTSGRPLKKPVWVVVVKGLDEKTVRISYRMNKEGRYGKGSPVQEVVDVSRLERSRAGEAMRDRASRLAEMPAAERKAVVKAERELTQVLKESPFFWGVSAVQEIEAGVTQKQRQMAEATWLKRARAQAAELVGMGSEDLDDPAVRAAMLPKVKAWMESEAGKGKMAEDAGAETIYEIKRQGTRDVQEAELPDGALVYKEGQWFEVDRETGVTRLMDGKVIEIGDFESTEAQGWLEPGDPGYDRAVLELTGQEGRITREQAKAALLAEGESSEKAEAAISKMEESYADETGEESVGDREERGGVSEGGDREGAGGEGGAAGGGVAAVQGAEGADAGSELRRGVAPGGQVQMFGQDEGGFTLVGQDAVDGGRVMRERADREAAAAARDRAQGSLRFKTRENDSEGRKQGFEYPTTETRTDRAEDARRASRLSEIRGNSRRSLEDAQRKVEALFGPESNEFRIIRNVTLDETLLENDEFWDVHEENRAAGIRTVPIQSETVDGFQFEGTIYITERGLGEGVVEHEQFHVRFESGDPSARGLVGKINQRSETFARRKRHLESLMGRAYSAAEVAEEIAADFYSDNTLKRDAQGDYDLNEAFLTDSRPEALLYKMLDEGWQVGKAGQRIEPLPEPDIARGLGGVKGLKITPRMAVREERRQKMHGTAERVANGPYGESVRGRDGSYYEPVSFEMAAEQARGLSTEQLMAEAGRLGSALQEHEVDMGAIAGAEAFNRLHEAVVEAARSGDRAALDAARAARDGWLDRMNKLGMTAARVLGQFRYLKAGLPGAQLAIIEKQLGEKGLVLREADRKALEAAIVEDARAVRGFLDAEKEFKANPTEATAKAKDGAEAVATVTRQKKADAMRVLPKDLADQIVYAMQMNVMTPISLAGNMWANLMFGLPELAARQQAAVVDRLVAAWGGKPRVIMGISGREVAAGAAALRKAGPALKNIVARGDAGDIGAQGEQGAMRPWKAWVDLATGRMVRYAKTGRVPTAEVIGKLIEGSGGMAAEPIGRGLKLGDYVYSRPAEAMALVELGRLQGLEGAELEAFLRNPPAAAKAAAHKEALRAVFQEQGGVSGWASGMLQNLKKKGKKGKVAYVAARTVVPFIKTPLNILGRTLEYVPVVGLWRTSNAALKGDARGVRMGLARQVVGVEMLTAVGFAAAMGVLFGSPEDEKRRQIAGVTTGMNRLNVSGLRRALARMQAGNWDMDDLRDAAAWRAKDETMGFNYMGLAGIFMSMVANSQEEMGAIRRSKNPWVRDMSNWAAWGSAIGLNVGNAILDLSMMKGAYTALQAIAEKRPKKLVANMVTTLASVGLPRTIEAAQDAYWTWAPETKGKTIGEEVGAALMQRIPGPGYAELPVRRDYFGRPVRNVAEDVNPWMAKLVNVFQPGRTVADPIDRELADVLNDTQDVRAFPSIPDRSYVKPDGNEVIMSPAQWSKHLRNVGAARRGLMEEVRRDGGWKDMPAAERLLVADRIYEVGQNLGRMMTEAEMAGGDIPWSQIPQSVQKAWTAAEASQ
jgi:hypothetical protein